MTGLDKIIQDIKDEADTSASELLAKASEEEMAIRKDAQEDGAKKCAEIKRRADEQVAAVKERAQSAAALQKRKAVLTAKQQIIAEIIEKAKQSLYVLPAEEYFGIILKMLKKYAPPQNGEIMFSPTDSNRLPKDFESSVNAVMKEKGAVLKISRQTRKIDGGFVLVYGGIEENCSFEALFDAKHDELQDKVHGIVFSGG